MLDVRELSPARLEAIESYKQQMGAMFQMSRAKRETKVRAAPPVFLCDSCGCERWRPDGGPVCVSCELARSRQR